MVRESLVKLLMENPWFQALQPAHFKKMVDIAKEVSWIDGETIFREGDRGDGLYLVLEGHVALEIYVPGQGRVTILTLGPTEVFGWSAVTPVVGTRTASARAAQATRAIVFDSVALRRACEADPSLGYQVFKRLTNVIAGRLTATRLQLLNVYATSRE